VKRLTILQNYLSVAELRKKVCIQLFTRDSHWNEAG